jgi:hypothetical protein
VLGMKPSPETERLHRELTGAAPVSASRVSGS